MKRDEKRRARERRKIRGTAEQRRMRGTGKEKTGGLYIEKSVEYTKGERGKGKGRRKGGRTWAHFKRVES